MSETYRHGGVAHEIVDANHNTPGSKFLWITVRCGAQLPPQLGPANIGDDNDAVTCLECLGTPVVVEQAVEPDEADDDYGDYGRH